MFADTGESETVFAPVIQAGVEAFKVSHSTQRHPDVPIWNSVSALLSTVSVEGKRFFVLR